MGNAVLQGQVQVGRLVKTTFRPLSRNRYRCIQTGELVTRKRLSAYCRARQNSSVRKPPPLPPPLPTSTARIDFGDVRCPNCSRWKFGVKPGPVTCSNCSHRFTTVE